MRRTLPILGVLTVTCVASGAPWTLLGARVIGQADDGFRTGPLTPFIADGGVFWDATLSASPAAGEIPTSTLVGAHPCRVPTGDPDSAALVGAVPIVAANPLSADGDTAFDIGFTFPSGGVFSEFIWLGQYFAKDPEITLLLNTGGPDFVEIGTNGASGVDPVTGMPLILHIEPIFGQEDAFDLFVGPAISRNGCFYDISNDGVVDIIDFGAFAGLFGASEGDAAYDARFDFNLDGAIDIIDFGMFAGEFGETGCIVC